MQHAKHYIFLLLGTFIIALCFNILQNPNQIASGGLTGASLVISHFFDVVPSVVLWGSTVILLGIGFCFLGKQTIIKSVIGSLLIPLFVYLTKELPALTNDPLLAAIFSGMGIGLGLTLVFLVGGNTGGFTLISQILNNKWGIKHSSSILVMDAIVIIVGGIVFSPEKALYALVGAFITRITMELIQSGLKSSKVAYIISSKFAMPQRYLD